MLTPTVLGVLSSLWCIPIGILLHRKPVLVAVAITFLVLTYAARWAALDVAMLCAGIALGHHPQVDRVTP